MVRPPPATHPRRMTSSASPGSLPQCSSIDAGYYYTRSCALLSTGAVSCWGANTYGQLGDGSTTDRLSPVQVRQFPVGPYRGVPKFWTYGSLAVCCACAQRPGFSCRARVTPVSSPASHCQCKQCVALTSPSPFAPRARLRQSFSRTQRSQKHNFFNGSKT
jgi:hypothetical protein